MWGEDGLCLGAKIGIFKICSAFDVCCWCSVVLCKQIGPHSVPQWEALLLTLNQLPPVHRSFFQVANGVISNLMGIISLKQRHRGHFYQVLSEANHPLIRLVMLLIIFFILLLLVVFLFLLFLLLLPLFLHLLTAFRISLHHLLHLASHSPH